MNSHKRKGSFLGIMSPQRLKTVQSNQVDQDIHRFSNPLELTLYQRRQAHMLVLYEAFFRSPEMQQMFSMDAEGKSYPGTALAKVTDDCMESLPFAGADPFSESDRVHWKVLGNAQCDKIIETYDSMEVQYVKEWALLMMESKDVETCENGKTCVEILDSLFTLITFCLTYVKGDEDAQHSIERASWAVVSSIRDRAPDHAEFDTQIKRLYDILLNSCPESESETNLQKFLSLPYKVNPFLDTESTKPTAIVMKISKESQPQIGTDLNLLRGAAHLDCETAAEAALWECHARMSKSGDKTQELRASELEACLSVLLHGLRESQTPRQQNRKLNTQRARTADKALGDWLHRHGTSGGLAEEGDELYHLKALRDHFSRFKVLVPVAESNNLWRCPLRICGKNYTSQIRQEVEEHLRKDHKPDNIMPIHPVAPGPVWKCALVKCKVSHPVYDDAIKHMERDHGQLFLCLPGCAQELTARELTRQDHMAKHHRSEQPSTEQLQTN